jgi:A/G-specific adenine glycosylase
MYKNKVKVFVKRLILWHSKKIFHFPWRKTSNPYNILVAEIMLQKTKTSQVEKIYPIFIRMFPNAASLSKANKKTLIKVLKPLGLVYRVDRLKKMAKVIVEKFDGSVPKSRKELLMLPGIGDYIANAIMSFAYNLPYPTVDRNVVRIVERVFNVKGYKNISNLLQKIIPKKKHKEFNWALLDLGRTICTKNSPKCKICPLKDICSYASGV